MPYKRRVANGVPSFFHLPVAYWCKLAINQTVQVQVNFWSQTKHGMFHDNLYFPEDIWDQMPDDTLESMKQARIDNWVYRLDNPPPPPEPIDPTKDELIANLSDINQKQVDIITVLTPLQTKEELQGSLEFLQQRAVEIGEVIGSRLAGAE